MSCRSMFIVHPGIVLIALVVFFTRSVAFSADEVLPDRSPANRRPPKIDPGPPPVDGPVPNVVFTAVHHDFGTVTAGKSPKTEFSFSNTGDEKLVIESVKGG